MLENPYISFLVFIMGFNFLIFIHELGHFAVARACGIRATQFAIFFGPAIVSYRKGLGLRAGSTEPEYRRRAVERLRATGEDPAGRVAEGQGQAESGAESGADSDLAEGYSEEQLNRAADALGLGATEYRLNWVPLGGYVKMVGQEDLDPNARSNDPGAYNNKSIPARMAVISAGVVMNMIFGVLFFIVAFEIGVNFPPSVVGSVHHGGPAAYAYAEGHEDDRAYRGLRGGDVITRVDGEAVTEMMEVQIATALGNPDIPVRLDVRRTLDEGRTVDLVYKVKPERLPGSRLYAIGIEPPASITVAEVRTRSEAERAGVRPGMALVEAAGEAVPDRAALDRVFSRHAGHAITLVYEHPETGARAELEVTPPRPLMSTRRDQPFHAFGFVPAIRIDEVIAEGPADGVGLAVDDLITRLADWPAGAKSIPAAIQQQGGDAVSLEVIRDGRSMEVPSVTPRNGLIGVRISNDTEGHIAHVLPDTPAGRAFAQRPPPGSRVVSVDGEAFVGWTEFLTLVRDRAAAGSVGTAAEGSSTGDGGLSLELVLALPLPDEPTETVTLTISPEWIAELDYAAVPPADIYAGVIPRYETIEVKAANPLEAAWMGAVRTYRFTVQTYLTIKGLLFMRVPVQELRGPVGIVEAGTIATQRGVPYFLFFLGLISINLAVINFLPIPIVDGGHMVFLIVEAITGKPASPQVQNVALIAGLVFIGSFFLLVTYHDIVRVLTGG